MRHGEEMSQSMWVMHWGMWLIALLIVVLLLLGIAALVRYLFGRKPPQ